MSERPFMQIYVSDFLVDTLSLSAEQVGAYALLLAALWNAGGTLPSDEAKLARIARMSVVKWRKTWPALRPFFDENDGTIATSRHVKKWFSKASVLGRVSLSAALRNSIYDRDGPRCRYCGSTEGPFHVDHVISVARGGSDDPGNLVIACVNCNLSKGAKTLEEWRG